MLSLPRDTLIEILSNLEDSALLNLCSSNRQLEQICNDELLWKIKVAKRNIQGTKNLQTTWKQYYLDVTHIKSIPVYSNDLDLYSILIGYDSTFGEIFNLIENNINSGGLYFPIARILFQDKNDKTVLAISRQFKNINANRKIGKMLNALESINALPLTTGMTGTGRY